jgi:hypothetical protein
MNLSDLRNRLTALRTDPRARRLLPVLALLIVAAVAVPALLSRPGRPAPVAALPSVPAVTPPATVAITGAAQTRRGTAVRVAGHPHNPFLQPSSASAPAASPSAAASAPSPAAAAAPTPVATQTTPSATVITRTVTVTTPARTPAPTHSAPVSDRYSIMEVKVTLRRQGSATHAMVFDGLSRDELMPSDLGAFITFLGVQSRHDSAVFVLADSAAVHGAGRCQRVARHCRFLILTPHESVMITVTSASGVTRRYRFTYASVRRVTTSASVVSVDQMGRRYLRTLAAHLRPLATIRYASHTGLIQIRLGRTQPVG